MKVENLRICKNGIEYRFDGHLDRVTVLKLAERFNYSINEIEHVNEDNFDKTVITGYGMPPQLHSLLVEISDFEKLGPTIKNYFINQGLTPLSRHRPTDREKWKVFNDHDRVILKICDWDYVFFGCDQYDNARRHLIAVLDI